MKRCAFCPTEPNKLTGEHIWDDWLNREWTATELQQTVKAVCAECNSTWMSRLSDSFRNGFRHPLLNGSRFCILPSGLALLSAYVFLKAAAVDYVYPDVEPFFTRAERENFRLSLAIPSYVQGCETAIYGYT